MGVRLPRFLLTLGLVLSLTGCAPGLPLADSSAVADPGPERMFRSGFDRIGEVFIEPVDFGQLSVDGLRGLASLDEEFGAERQGNLLRLRYHGEVIGEYAAPGQRNARAWADVTAAAVDRARARSDALRAAENGALYDAMFSALSRDLDSYSRYVGPDRARQERASRDGYGGIGMLLGRDDRERPIVQEVFGDGPAYDAGVPAGSLILAIDGQPATDWEIDRIADALRGPLNTRVTLTVQPGDGEPRQTYSLTRQRVILNMVRSQVEDGIAILQVSRFNAATSRHLAEALAALFQPGASPVHGLILDLRGNPGGLLGQAVAVADLFLRHGEIVSTRGRHPDSMQFYSATSSSVGSDLPMVVLIDGRSASGAEIVAAALQDLGRAIVVGASSYGKGSVQTVSRLPNDGELFLTWSRIYAPSGYTLHLQGVMPTVCTSGGIQDVDQLVWMFRTGELVVPSALTHLRRAAPDDQSALDQLRATCPWREHDDAFDVEIARRVLEDSNLYARALSLSAAPNVAQR